jgi:hypothetical protein
VSYRIVIAHEAEKVLNRLQQASRAPDAMRFLQLAEDPFDLRLSSPLTERAGMRNRE